MKIKQGKEKNKTAKSFQFVFTQRTGFETIFKKRNQEYDHKQGLKSGVKRHKYWLGMGGKQNMALHDFCW